MEALQPKKMQTLHTLSRHVRYLLLVLAFVCWGSEVTHAQTIQEQTIPMPDGIKLAATIVLPSTGKGPWPVLLQRTPYKYQVNTGLSAYGIVVVHQNTRGRYKSEGNDTLFGDDRVDGAATIGWLRKQSWCNGIVHTTGGSALGVTQLMLAEAVPVDGQIITVGTPDLYKHGVFWGGVLRQSLIVEWSNNQAKTNNMTVPHPTLLDFINHPLSNAKIWDSRRINDWSKINTPALHIGGWYDIFSQGTINSYVGYKTKGASTFREQQYLVMGPWTHSIGKQKNGDLTYPENATKLGPITPSQFQNAWYLKYLLKRPSGLLDKLASVNIYVMGDPTNANSPANRWFALQHWPPASKATPYYLHKDNKLSLSQPAQDEAPESYQYDPKDPVPTNGGNNLTILAGPKDQRIIEARKDVLTYTTNTLTQDVAVVGRIQAKLWIATDAKDTDFAVKLTDVYPDGRSMLVLDGIVKLRHRNTTTKEEFITPNTPTEITVDLWSTAIVFEKGHKLRVAITSSNAPRFQPNPNTGAPLSLSYTQTVIAKNTIYHDAMRPSRIILPVVDLSTIENPNPKEPTPEMTQEPNPQEPQPRDASVEPDLTPEESTESPAFETTPEPKESKVEQDPKPELVDSGREVKAPESGCGCQQQSPGTAISLLMLLVLCGVFRRGSRACKSENVEL
ncbi:MAG: hypothetical protein CL920_26660 [Deltaproteobacteria bacterium]|nr:hypothetical protein [Deltaproteobacteria bacterium]MBU52291.1 hypothetical protein [Deltaproteobacteria bacterium]|tara:strand:+ start:183 stop:2210 length:2028 start_codon:yes stop_codon:yes gene_type:complete